MAAYFIADPVKGTFSNKQDTSLGSYEIEKYGSELFVTYHSLLLTQKTRPSKGPYESLALRQVISSEVARYHIELLEKVSPHDISSTPEDVQVDKLPPLRVSRRRNSRMPKPQKRTENLRRKATSIWRGLSQPGLQARQFTPQPHRFASRGIPKK